jgi:hypothetical protein
MSYQSMFRPPVPTDEAPGSLLSDLVRDRVDLEAFDLQLHNCSSEEERFQLCVERQNQLLEEHGKLDVLFTGYEHIMSACCQIYRTTDF